MELPNVHFDGELMHQNTPSTPISKTSSHHVIRDSADGHMVLSIGDSGELFLLRPNGFNGQYSLLDLSSQDSERQISLAFVAAGDNGKPGNQLWVLKPQAATLFEAADEKSQLATSVLQGEEAKKDARIEQLFLGDVPDPSTGYPVLVAIYQRTNLNVLDAAHIEVNFAASKWTYNPAFQLPEDPKQMIDMACGNLPTGDFGLFYLYSIQGVGKDSTSIATFVDNDGDTDLVVASGGELHHYTAFVCSQSRSNESPPAYKVISSNSTLLRGLQQLSLSRTPFTASQPGSKDICGSLTFFFRNDESTVVYQTFDMKLVVADDEDAGKVSSLTAQGAAVPLLTAKEGGGRFAALLEPATGNHKLFIVDSAGSVLTLMEQSSSTKLWQSLKILVPSTGVNSDVLTFTSHVKLLGPQKQSLASKEVLLRASSPVDLAVNAKSTRVTTEGVRVTIDKMSTLTIIHNVSDISTVLLTISDIPDIMEPILGAGSVTFDPSKKVQAKLEDLASSVTNLRSATLSTGEKLIPEEVKDEDVVSAASVLGDLFSRIGQLNKDNKGLEPSEGSDMDVEAGKSAVTAAVGATVSEWGLWHWITTSGTHVITKWFVSLGEFVVETAKGIYRFVLTTPSHVMKAITYVFENIKVGATRLASALAFLFNWEDVLDMRTVLAHVINVGIETLGATLEIFGEAADDWFDQLDEQLATMDVPELAKSHKISLNASIENEHSRSLDSPGGNWTNYQLQHGDVGKSLLSQQTSSPQKGAKDPFSDTWTQVILPILDRIRNLLSHLGSNFLALFTNKELSLGDLLKHLGVDVLRDLVKIIKDLVVGLMKFSSILVLGLHNVMNAKIEIPLLSPLYRKISGNQNLTMVDAICLLVAIPTTVLYKAVTKKHPRDDPIIKDLLDNPLKRQEISLSRSPFDALTLTAIAIAQPPAKDGDSKMQTDAQANMPSSIGVSNIATINISGVNGESHGWLQTALDKCRWLCSKIIDFIKLLPRIIGFCMPVVNGISAYLAPKEWLKPPAPDIMEAAAANPADHYSPPTKLWIGIGILSCAGSFPLDCLNPLIGNLHKFGTRPAPGLRFTFWVLGMTYVPFLVCCKQKRALALVQGVIAMVQLPVVGFINYYDTHASKEEYPNRDDYVVEVTASQLMFAQVARIAAAIASHGNGVIPPAEVALPMACVFSAASVAAQGCIVGSSYKSGGCHEVASLFGL